MKKQCRTSFALATAALAGVGSLAMTGAASADFTVTLSAPTTSGGVNIYNVYALDNGGTTGTNLDLIVSTITTGGSTTATALAIQLKDVDFDGAADANVIGAGLTATSADTFERIGSVTTFSPTLVTPSPSTTDPGGKGYPTQSINAAYTAGNVHSLDVEGISTTSTNGVNGVAADASPGALFAHVVVPVNTYFTVAGFVGGNIGVKQSFSVNDASTASIVQLTAGTALPAAGFGAPLTAANATFTPAVPVANSINVTGVGGKIVPGTVHVGAPTSTAGTAEGNVLVSGFSTAGTEVYGLNLLVNGADPTTAQVTQIVTDINASSAIDGVTASPVSATNTGGLAATFDVLLTATIAGASQDVLGFNFDNELAVPGVVVTDIAAVPEPTSVALLAAPVVALLARRRQPR